MEKLPFFGDGHPVSVDASNAPYEQQDELNPENVSIFLRTHSDYGFFMHAPSPEGWLFLLTETYSTTSGSHFQHEQEE